MLSIQPTVIAPVLPRCIRQLCHCRLWPIALAMCAVLSLAGQWAARADAATLRLTDGTTVEGVVIQAFHHSVIVRLAQGGVRSVLTKSLAIIDVGPVSGAYHAWIAGGEGKIEIYQLRRGSEIISVREDGKVLEREELPPDLPPSEATVAVGSLDTSLEAAFKQFVEDQGYPPSAGKDELLESFLIWWDENQRPKRPN